MNLTIGRFHLCTPFGLYSSVKNNFQSIKIFVCLWLGGGRYDMKDGVSRIALKLSPDRNIELREQFSAVTPAYHWNKTHWSDVYYEEMEEAIVVGLIRESYQLIVSKLPKAIRAKYLSA